MKLFLPMAQLNPSIWWLMVSAILVKANDIILVDTAAHHANIVPWQQLWPIKPVRLSNPFH